LEAGKSPILLREQEVRAPSAAAGLDRAAVQRGQAASEALPAWGLRAVAPEVVAAGGGDDQAHEQGESYERLIKKPHHTYYS
jgi:hypothetical protein